jgi:hypothetical protein
MSREFKLEDIHLLNSIQKITSKVRIILVAEILKVLSLTFRISRRLLARIKKKIQIKKKPRKKTSDLFKLI